MPKAKHLPSPEEILAFLASAKGKIGKREIARAFHIKGDLKIPFKALLKKMKGEGVIPGAKTKKNPVLPSVIGVSILKIDEDGYLILAPLDPQFQQKRFSLRPSERTHALGVGDHILVRLGKRPIFLKRLQGAPERIVGVVHRDRRGLYLKPASRKDRKTYPFDDPHVHEEDIIVVQRSAEKIKVQEKIGSLKDPRVVSLLALAIHDIPNIFPEEVLAEAQESHKKNFSKREDLRHLDLVTIDGEDARDFDDAVWAEKTEEGWHLVVAIADVSFYVEPGSALDKEAFKRGNSVYFPDRVVPMLPEALSNDLCSLRPKEDRPCFAVHMWVDEKGKLVRYQFMRGIMYSRARLTYGQVQAALNGTLDEMTAPLLEPILKPLQGAYKVLLQAREKRGTLDLDIPEKKIVFDQKGHISTILTQERLDSHRIIEEFMILANVAAASQLEDKKRPCLYRIHDRPQGEKIFSLMETLKGLGFPWAPKDTPKAFNQLINAVADKPYKDMIQQLILRCQSQAVYSPENKGHFGLNLMKYAHFTSPIRRYADLIVHRRLIELLEKRPAAEEDLKDIGEHISTTERRAMLAERDAFERYGMLYLASHRHKVFEGRISGVSDVGLFIELLSSGSQGFVPLRTLPEDRYMWDPKKHTIQGRRRKKIYRLGDLLSVRIVNLDMVTNSLQLEEAL